MPINRAVLNASPLICLQKSGLSGLLPKLFSDIIVTNIVKAEVLAKGTVDVPMEALFANDWFRIADVAIDPDIAAWGLGRGEESVLSYALHDRSCWAVIDDRVARRCAESMKCLFTGTVGIIVLAKRRLIIPNVREALGKLQDAGLWLSAPFIGAVCEIGRA